MAFRAGSRYGASIDESGRKLATRKGAAYGEPERYDYPMANDDARLCVKYMTPEIQKIIGHGYGAEQLLDAATKAFNDLVRERDGESFCPEVQGCHAELRAMIEMTKKEFAHHAILASMMGLVINFYMIVGFPECEIEAAKDAMMAELNRGTRVN
jgi:hypothetical protein